ncbi:MAG: type IIA DNA topoisomerase subunit B [Bacteroidales bacterium]|nr:type IIA DNA topoisomerase subunit B [Bacteroidales bacterium]MCF8327423.1 type IIA DNA topoisomerase subunit B [Bacteroidales bacterium]
MQAEYNEQSIKSLDWKDHIRTRPGMYIGKLGEGSSKDDGIYVLVKETIDNSIDEFVMGHGKKIDIKVEGTRVSIRDYGRGIPLGKVLECVSKINTGAKYDSQAFKKSVGLNGVGTKAVNALSEEFIVKSVREGQAKVIEYKKGELISEELIETTERNGTFVQFVPDKEIFGNYRYISEYIEKLLWNYAYLNKGLTLNFNGQLIRSENGLLDLLQDQVDEEFIFPIIHFSEGDFECAFSYCSRKYGEDYHSFVNGQYTPQGGTHQAAFREAIVKTIREFYKKDFEPSDIRGSIASAFSIKIQEPVFESQTKTKLGSQHMSPNGQTVRNYVTDIVKRNLDNYLHRHPETADLLLQKIQLNERERKEMAGIKKKARETAKRASLHNKKLRDCKVHYNSKHDDRLESTLFITEGDSASGSITKARNVRTQAVFSLKGKPLNSFGLSKKIVYENEEFNLLQTALNIEDSLENLRYNNIVIATDADVDGMHIRMLLLTFFLKFFPELVKKGHLYILQTPLYRVRNRQTTLYCYSEPERREAIEKLKGKPEITRFKGLGEISPDEFVHLIGKDIRLEPIILKDNVSTDKTLKFYMGKNTPQRQDFIIDNLRFELDVIEKNQSEMPLSPEEKVNFVNT